MLEIKCDVLIVGLSAAGLGAASALSKSGLSVICIEKKHSAGTSIHCAEGVGKYFVDLLPVKLPKELLEWPVAGVAFFMGDKWLKKTGPIWRGYSVNRGKIEKFVYKKAKSNNIRFFFNSTLSSITTGRNGGVNKVIFFTKRKKQVVVPKYVVAADGVDSKVRKLLKMKTNPEITGEIINYEIRSKYLDYLNYEQIYLGGFAPSGYGFIFPKSKYVANVGVGCIMPTVQMKGVFNKFVLLPEVKRQLKDMQILKDKSKKAAFGDTLKKWVYSNVIFVGDSANHNFKPFIEGFLPSFIAGFTAGSMLKNGGGISDFKFKSMLNSALPGFFENKELQKSMLTAFKYNDKMRASALFLLSSGIIRPQDLRKLSKNKLLDLATSNLKSIK